MSISELPAPGAPTVERLTREGFRVMKFLYHIEGEATASSIRVRLNDLSGSHILDALDELRDHHLLRVRVERGKVHYSLSSMEAAE